MMSVLKPISFNHPQTSKITPPQENDAHPIEPSIHCIDPLSENSQSTPFFASKKEKPKPNKLMLSYEINQQTKSSPLTVQEDDLEKTILDTFKNDDMLNLGEKITFCCWLVLNRNSLNEKIINNLNEEECHLNLLNWIWKYNKKLKQYSLLFLPNFNNGNNSNIEFNKLIIEINLILELLINILNVFVFLPINSRDILHLKLYEKLIKIKEYIKSYANEYLLNLIQLVLNKWKAIVDEDEGKKIINKFKLNLLGRKTERSDEDKDTEADSEDGTSNNNKIININLSNNIKKTKKNIKVSFDLNQNRVMYFRKEDIPLVISNQKKLIN